MKKKVLTAAALVTAIAASLMGCSSSDKQNTDGVKSIRFASWDNSKDLDEQQKLVDKFNEAHKDIKVTLEAYGSDFDTKIAAGMGSKDTPDVMYMWNYPAYYEGLEPLDSYIEKEGQAYKDNFYETLWSYNEMGDTVYGIPVGFTTHVLYYNKDIFDAAGVDYPTESWTFKDLEDAAGKLTDPEKNITGFGFKRVPDPYDFEMFLWSNGTALSDDQGNLKDYVNSDPSVQVFSTFQNMEKEGVAVATDKDGTDEMMAGKIAMYINGSWPISSFNDAGLNYGVVEIPMFKEGSPSVSILSSSGLAMAKDSKNKEAAWEFIKYWTSEDLNRARIQYELPVLKSVVQSESLENDVVKGVFYSMLQQSEGYTPTSFKTKNWSEISDSLSTAFENIFNSTVYGDPKTVLDEVAGQ
ncbi:ABC transporter substrate-binding protein [Lacrimispora indolis]|uniref:ABC transporter substrate-binding protein n=1 Tax=Lacrimispora indolis TaxID=69825 RepID=UPI00045EBBC3|nr:sugar ABC transporter substrate-binding protein [Lacrimispora indolis]